MPVFAHLEGICHVYVDKAADRSTWPRPSCSTPRCAAPASAARRRRCWSIAPAARRISSRWSRCCSTPAARCAATRRRRPSMRASSPPPKRTGRTEYLDAIIAVKVVDGVDAAHRPYRALRLAPHRRHRHRGQGRGGEVPGAGRFGDRAAQRLDPIRRRRRVRLRRRDRHRHRAPARARARSASSSSPPSNTASAAAVRSGRDKAKTRPPRAHSSAPRARHEDRLVRRHFRSAARGASGRQPAGDEAAQARPGLVAGDAGQSAEKHQRPCAACRRGSPPRAR